MRCVRTGGHAYDGNSRRAKVGYPPNFASEAVALLADIGLFPTVSVGLDLLQRKD